MAGQIDSMDFPTYLRNALATMGNSQGPAGAGPAGYQLQSSLVLNDLYKQRAMDNERQQLELQQARQSMAKTNGKPPRGAGIGFDRIQAPRNEGSGGSSWEREQMDRQRSERDFQQQRKQGIQTKKDDMGFLQQIMSMYGGGNGSGRGNSEEGYTEQIFNNAGAPQVVRLKNGSTQDSMGDILKMLMSKYG